MAVEADSITTFFKWPVLVPAKTTVKPLVVVDATEVNSVVKILTGTEAIGCSPPRGEFTSRPQKSSLIVCNFYYD